MHTNKQTAQSGKHSNDPIRIDWIPTELWSGKLGLTFAPGKKGRSILQQGLVHSRDMQQDMQTLAQHGVSVICPLIEDFEFELLKMEHYHTEAEAANLTVLPHPIVDGNIPNKLPIFQSFVGEILQQLKARRSVVLHCRGGLGRAGLTAACLLSKAGMPPSEAIALVRKHRVGAIENATQEQFVADFTASNSG